MLGSGLLVDSAAIGMPDPVKGTAVVCVCVPRPGIDQDAAMKALSAAVAAGLGGCSGPPQWSSFPTCRARAACR